MGRENYISTRVEFLSILSAAALASAVKRGYAVRIEGGASITMKTIIYGAMFMFLLFKLIALRRADQKLASTWLGINGVIAFLLVSGSVIWLFLGTMFFDDPRASYKLFLLTTTGSALAVGAQFYFAFRQRSRKEYLQSVRISLVFIGVLILMILYSRVSRGI
jgi:hypothetical protein